MNKPQQQKVLKGPMAGLIKKVMKWYTKLNIVVYKASQGRFMNTFPGGFAICILTVVGRKTGVPRDVPLLHMPFMDKKILLASQGGLPKNPVWYYNVVASQEIKITVYGKTKGYKAIEMTDEEKEYYLPHIVAIYPDFSMYMQRTERNIPIFLCSPVTA